jgi:hypothetical protein
LDGILLHANVLHVVRYKHRQEFTMGKFIMLKEEEGKEKKRRRRKEEEGGRKYKRRGEERRRGGGRSLHPGGGRSLQASLGRYHAQEKATTREGPGPVLPASLGRYYRPALSATSNQMMGGTSWTRERRGDRYLRLEAPAKVPARGTGSPVMYTTTPRYLGWSLRPRYR